MAIDLLFNSGARRTTIDSITLDASLSEKHGATSEITEHPVENGTDVSDNIRIKPDTVQIQGIVSNSPLALQDRLDALGDLLNGGLGRAETAYNNLLALRESKKLVTIVTTLRTYANMAMESLDVPRDVTLGDAVHFTATFKQVRVATSQTSQISQANAKPKASNGQKVAKPTPPAVSGPPKSLLAQGLDAIAGHKVVPGP